jgi:hypothetical protein
MVVHSYFDSEHDTVKNACPDCEVYSFGIGSGAGHVHLDLSYFERAIIDLEKYPAPDVIIAFPPCETWCFVSVGSKRHYTSEPGINLYWKNKWSPFDFTSKHFDWRMNGVRTLEFLSKIISHYKPRYWFIENGTRSLAFSYLNENLGLAGYKNLTNYYSYGFYYLKPTTIYSNIELRLKNYSPSRELQKIETHLPGLSKSELYSHRSMVPFGLCQDILSQAQAGGVPQLFPEFL